MHELSLGRNQTVRVMTETEGFYILPPNLLLFSFLLMPILFHFLAWVATARGPHKSWEDAATSSYIPWPPAPWVWVLNFLYITNFQTLSIFLTLEKWNMILYPQIIWTGIKLCTQNLFFCCTFYSAFRIWIRFLKFYLPLELHSPSLCALCVCVCHSCYLY